MTDYDPTYTSADLAWMGDEQSLAVQLGELTSSQLMWLSMDLSTKPGVAGDPQYRGSLIADPTDGNSGRATASVPITGNQDINGVLMGFKWATASGLTYSFPTTNQTYGTSQGGGAGQYPDAEPYAGFSQVTLQQQADIKRAFAEIFSFALQPTFIQITDAATQGGTPHAVLRFANSSVPATANARFPTNSGTYAPEPAIKAGDVFYGGTGGSPVPGNFDSGNAEIHEIGHALGLKHGHDPGVYGTLPANHDDNEYSVMTYRAFIGGGTGASPIGPGSSPQTYMMDDIAAFQDMYGGAFYGSTGMNQSYTWSPTTGQEFINGVSQFTPFNNHIFSTVWTGGSNSTYDLSNYNTNGILDMRPGMGFNFSQAQRADLDFFDTPGLHLAQYNVYNSMNYNGNTASEVRNLITGNGNNTVQGNDVFNTVRFGSGNNTFTAGAGGDSVTASGGSNVFNAGAGANTFTENGGSATINGAPGNGAINIFGGATPTTITTNNANSSAVAGTGDFTFTSNGGNSTVTGGAGNNTISVDGNDVFNAGAGTNTFIENGGNATVNGAPSNGPITIFGGLTDTTITANNAAVTAIAGMGGGDFTFTSNSGDSTVTGGAAANFISDNGGDIVFNAGDGTNIITENGGEATVNGAPGNGAITIYGGATATVVTTNNANASAYGGGGDFSFSGNGGNSTVVGGAGSNTIYAFGGDDYIQGGSGGASDVLVATGPGNDTFYGGSGNNYIVGGSGANTMVGGGGPLNSLYGNGLTDYIVGGTGTSNVLVEENASSLGNDSLWGGLSGANYIVGGGGNELLVGGPSSDYLFAGPGNDTLYGGNGTDYIYTGPGQDFIWTDNVGSKSTDYIYETGSTGTTTVADFTPGDGAAHDVLSFSGTNLHSFADVQAHATQQGVYTVIAGSSTDQTYLYNITPSQLTANDFIFT